MTDMRQPVRRTERRPHVWLNPPLSIEAARVNFSADFESNLFAPCAHENEQRISRQKKTLRQPAAALAAPGTSMVDLCVWHWRRVADSAAD